MYSLFFTLYIILIGFIGVTKSDHYPWGSVNKERRPSSEKQRLETLALDTYTEQNVGHPLILTPYIEKGKILTGRKLSLVKPQLGNWPSYSGYFTVNKECEDNLFFWFIQAKNNWQTAPVLLWLQGGPGSSSMFGLFELIGPFNHFPSGLEERKLTWNTDNNIIYIDQPVGSGFSFSSNNCFVENMTAVTEELYSGLVQFFQLFPELQKNKFFITGESFAGHYIPHLGLHIHQKNPTAKTKINLKGFLIGNPLTDLSCHDYATFLYDWGVIGDELWYNMTLRQEMLKTHTDLGQFKLAWDDWDYILNNLTNDLTALPSRECMIEMPTDQSDYISWISTAAVRKQIHVGNVKYSDINYDVYNNLINTIAEPMTSQIEKLLEAKIYSFGFYSGNLDFICLTTSTECILDRLQWWGSQNYQDAVRKPFSVDGWNSVAGWVKEAGPLYLVVIKDSGHSVPLYKPNVTLTLINKMTTAVSGVNPVTLLDT